MPRRKREVVQVVHVEYDAVPLATHEVTDAVAADLATTNPKKRPMSEAAKAVMSKAMKAYWAKNRSNP